MAYRNSQTKKKENKQQKLRRQYWRETLDLIQTKNSWRFGQIFTSEHNRFNLNETDELFTNVQGISISFFLLSAAMAGFDFAWNTERPFVLSEINHNVCIPSPVLLWPPSLFQASGRGIWRSIQQYFFSAGRRRRCKPWRSARWHGT